MQNQKTYLKKIEALLEQSGGTISVGGQEMTYEQVMQRLQQVEQQVVELEKTESTNPNPANINFLRQYFHG